MTGRTVVNAVLVAAAAALLLLLGWGVAEFIRQGRDLEERTERPRAPAAVPLPAAAPDAAPEPRFQGVPLSGWLAMLEDKDPGVRLEAQTALAFIGKPAVAPLARMGDRAE